MKGIKLFAAFILCLAMLFPTSCNTWKNMNQTGKDAIIGGGAGAAVGTGIGAIIGGGEGAWIGALLGGAVGSGAGALIGHPMDKQKAALEKELDRKSVV